MLAISANTYAPSMDVEPAPGLQPGWMEIGSLAAPHGHNEPLDVSGHPRALLLAKLKMMRVIRRAEEVIADLVESQHARTPCHLTIGQEAIAVGVSSALTSRDRVFGGHRSHGHYLAQGGLLDAMMAEVLGKVTGCSKGNGGSMHLVSMEHGFYGSVPIVAATVPVATGAALALKMDGGDAVAVSYLGDGAVEEGVVHESMNLAAILDVPVIFVCENNLFSSHLDVALRQLGDRMGRFADAAGVESELVDGNDVLAVADAAMKLVGRARRTRKPAFLEAVTYRWRGHVGHREDIDVGLRRRTEDLVEWKRRDPIARLELGMMAAGLLDDEGVAEMVAAVEAQVQAARDFAFASPYPTEARLLADVYAARPGARS